MFEGLSNAIEVSWLPLSDFNEYAIWVHLKPIINALGCSNMVHWEVHTEALLFMDPKHPFEKVINIPVITMMTAQVKLRWTLATTMSRNGPLMTSLENGRC